MPSLRNFVDSRARRAIDALMEVETDKAAMEIEVFDSGFLLKILAEEGDQIPAGQPIAI